MVAIVGKGTPGKLLKLSSGSMEQVSRSASCTLIMQPNAIHALVVIEEMLGITNNSKRSKKKKSPNPITGKDTLPFSTSSSSSLIS